MRNKKIFIAVLMIVVVGMVAYLRFNNSSPDQGTSQNTKDQAQKKRAGDSTIRIIAAGDLLPHDSVNLNAKTSNGYDYKQFFDPIKDELNLADVVFCNQESPSAPNMNISGFPVFNAPAEFAEDISAVGCNIISLANNHLFDRGQTGIDETRKVWNGLNPLAISGANRNQPEQDKISYFSVEGIKFAFVAFSEISNQSPSSGYGLNLLNRGLVNRLLGEAKDNADFVIVSAHWGTEYSSGINSSQSNWAKTFADLGADFIFGQGPHVLQPVDKIKNPDGGEAIVFYSLGNLLSTQLNIESLIGGFGVIDINKSTKKVINLSFYPTYMHYEWTAEEKASEDLLKRKNLNIYPLSKAAGPLAKSQNNTTVEKQLRRITGILNKYTSIDVKN